MELELFQRDVARFVGIDETTVYNWERGYTRPPLRYLPKVLEFLGYDPAPSKPDSLGQKLLKYRRDLGMTQKELARRIGIDPGTLSRLERNGRKNHATVIAKAEFFLGP